MLAATMGQSEIVKWLLGNPNCDINAQDENNKYGKVELILGEDL